MLGKNNSIVTMLRAAEWWFYKTPFIAVLFYACIFIDPTITISLQTLLFFISFIGIVCYGYLLNDWFDRDVDIAAGKTNRLSAISTSQFILLIIASLVTGLLPWLWLPNTATPHILLGIEMLLLTIYSMPPIRLKNRGWAALIADSGYSFVIPSLLTCSTFLTIHVSWNIIILFTIWTTIAGIRNILTHQLNDYSNDIATGVKTIAVAYGTAKTKRLTNLALAGMELAVFITLLFTVKLAVIAGIYILYIIFAYHREVFFLKHQKWILPVQYQFVSGIVFNEFYEKWLPVILLVLLVLKDASYLPLLIIHSILFYKRTKSFIIDLKVLYWWFYLPYYKKLRYRLLPAYARKIIPEPLYIKLVKYWRTK